MTCPRENNDRWYVHSFNFLASSSTPEDKEQIKLLDSMEESK